eukprot:12612429-Ditylum_brightwellii.AAC.2
MAIVGFGKVVTFVGDDDTIERSLERASGGGESGKDTGVLYLVGLRFPCEKMLFAPGGRSQRESVCASWGSVAVGNLVVKLFSGTAS